MFTRREVLGTAMVFSLWPALRAAAKLKTPPITRLSKTDDEDFWAGVRSQFELTPDSTNLVTVVRGVSTKGNRELVVAESARMNASRPMIPPNPYWKQEVRKKAAQFIAAPVENVALLRNTTEGVTTVISNWPLKPGDEILTSSAEHGPFYDTLAYRAARDKITIRKFHYPAPVSSPQSILDAIDQAMTPRTRLVMLGQVILFGQINPVRAIADQVHAKGAKLLVDGVLGVGHIATDVKAMDCDFYAAGFHKFACGPRATAVFYVLPGLVQQLASLFGRYDADEHGFASPQWNSDQMTKYETFGAHPDAHFIALGDALDFLSSIGITRVQSRLFQLTSRWMTRVQRLPKFRAAVKLDPEHCAGLVGFELAGIPSAEVRKLFTQRQVLVGGTGFYAGFFGIPENAPRWS
jgi:selenocysteine lyase/cysteine desulfurase